MNNGKLVGTWTDYGPMFSTELEDAVPLHFGFCTGEVWLC